VTRRASRQPERELVILSAGTVTRRCVMSDRAADLARDVNWTELCEALRARKLLPTLGPRIIEMADGLASRDFALAVERAITAGRRQGAFLQMVSQRVMSELADAGICTTPLKGPLLGEAIYGDPGRRLSSDVDLLVPTEQLRAAAEVVQGLGYRGPTDYVRNDGLPLLHFVLVHGRDELPPVELHWRVHWYERRFARERLLPAADAPRSDWRPSRSAELVALLLFYARDGFIDLRLASDLGAWWDKFGAEVRPGALGELLMSYPALAGVISASIQVVETMVGVPAKRCIGEIPHPRRRDRIAVRLANPNPRTSQSQLYADMGLVDGLLAPRGGFGAFVRRQLFPPRAVLKEHARSGAKGWPRSPAGRCAGMLARYSLTLTRLIRSPERPC
jgi:hypothetical protein